MILRKPLVLDANILIRAVLGVRVRHLMETCSDGTEFFAPEVALSDARRYLPSIAPGEGLNTTEALEVLSDLVTLVEIVDAASYGAHKERAQKRISHRDPADWPIIATALLLSAPIWTEDQDFFGCGVATWVTATVNLYLRP